MAKYDAFGREIGEDPLAAFRATPSATSSAAPPKPVVEAAEAEWVPPPPPAPRRRRRRGSARWLVSLAVLGVVLYAVGNVTTEVGGGIEDFVDGLPSETAPPATTTEGITGESLINKGNFAAAMRTLAGSGLGRPLTMRVAPDRIDATLIGDGRLHQVRITTGGAIEELASGPASTSRTIPYKAIDAGAPQRLVKAGATKQVPAAGIDYLVITPGPPVSWAAYYKGGRIVVGDAHGRKTRVL